MPVCVAENCKNVGIHRFPTDPKRRNIWEQAVNRENWKSSATSRLCASHFKPDDYIRTSAYTGRKPLTNHLKRNTVPSIFFTTAENIEPSQDTESQQLHNIESQSKRKLFPEAQLPNPNHNNIAQEIELEALPLDDLTVEDLNSALDSSTQINIEHVYASVRKHEMNNRTISYYTGFESYKKFHFAYCTLSPFVNKISYYGSQVINLSYEDQFYLTMMKLRRNTCYYELGLFFNVSETTASNICITWISLMDQLWKKLNIWPESDLIKYYMPEDFKKFDLNTRVIIDCTEISVQKPGNPASQRASWSSYKHANTLKTLVGSTPGGLLSYCSTAHAGSISDRQIFERSSLLEKCESGDSILADKGFNIQDIYANKDVKVNIPCFLKGRQQFPGLTVLRDRKISSKRVHIERLIGLVKTFKILKEELHHSLVTLASKIFFVCVMCCNFRDCIVKRK